MGPTELTRGERVLMAPNGEIVIGIPLFTRTQMPLQSMKLEKDEPAGWILEVGKQYRVFGPSVLKVLIDLGEL